MKNEKKNRMFVFINKTWSPIAGGFKVENKRIYACPYRCSYCWANILINKFPTGNLGKKYTGPYRIHEPAMKQWLKSGDFVFVQCMSDIGAPNIPAKVIDKVLDHMRIRSDIQFLILTKSDRFYIDYMHEIPDNCVCGITIETDYSISNKISKAPHPLKRLDSLIWMNCFYPHVKTLICIEPIMDFSKDFAEKIKKVNPWAVVVGYDNYNMGLPEPKLSKVENLISEIEKYSTVYKKTLRARSIK